MVCSLLFNVSECATSLSDTRPNLATRKGIIVDQNALKRVGPSGKETGQPGSVTEQKFSLLFLGEV